METLLDWLLLVAAYLPDPNLLLSALIAIAIVGQLYVAYRVWRPKVEVFTKISVPPPVAVVGRPANFDIANLSPTGIWVESISVIAQEADGKQGKSEQPAEMLIPASSKDSIRCEQVSYRAFSKTGSARGKYLGTVKVRCRYKVHGQWHHTPWTRKYEVIVSSDGILQWEGDVATEASD